MIGSIAGGVTAFATCYGWYQFSGIKTVANTAHQTKQYVDTSIKKLQESTPNPNEALKWLRQTATAYAGFVPGASGAVNTAFDELDEIHGKHKDEVDAIISDCYSDLKKATEKGFSADTVKQGFEIITKHLDRARQIASSATSEVLDRRPELKDKVGGNLDQLQQMGDRLGPEAKKIVDDARKQATEIASSGGAVLSADNINKIRQLVQDTTERVRKLGDEAWDKAMETAKPYLDKNPKVKELIEQNASALKKGNTGEVVQKIKDAAGSGDTTDLQNFVTKAASTAQSGAMGSLQDYLGKIPKGDEVMSNLSNLQKIAQQHGKEAEELFKSAVSDISQVLSQKAEEAKKLESKAENEVKK